MVNSFMKHYISPSVTEQHIQNLSVLCASGGRSATSNINVYSDGKSGDVTGAF